MATLVKPECPKAPPHQRGRHFMVDEKVVPTGKGDYIYYRKCKHCGFAKKMQGFPV